MDKIDNLKSEHARYKKALVAIRSGKRAMPAEAIANEALKGPPVTLDELKAALAKYKAATEDIVAIRFHSDESGIIQTGTHDIRGYSFCTLREAVNFLNDV